MKKEEKLEYFSSFVTEKYLVTLYWKGDKEMWLLLNISDTLKYLLATDLIREKIEGSTMEATRVLFTEDFDPTGPEDNGREVSQNITLEYFISMMGENEFMKIIEYQESNLNKYHEKLT